MAKIKKTMWAKRTLQKIHLAKTLEECSNYILNMVMLYGVGGTNRTKCQINHFHLRHYSKINVYRQISIN